jgi:putative endonuclease
MASTRDTGMLAEDLALAHLESRGLVLLKRNFRCRMGEIDLVMRDGAAIVFVEVRLRSRGSFASAAESVDVRKQRRIITAARFYLSGRPDAPCRFDCVLLERASPDAIEWIKSAFDA